MRMLPRTSTVPQVALQKLVQVSHQPLNPRSVYFLNYWWACTSCCHMISQNSRTIKRLVILQWSYFLKLFFSGKWGIIRLLGNLEQGSLEQGTYKMNGLNHLSPQSGLRHSGRTAGRAAPAQPGITCVEKQRASVLKYPACYSSENRAP